MTGDQLDLTEDPSTNESNTTEDSSVSEAPEKAPSVEDTVRAAVETVRGSDAEEDKDAPKRDALQPEIKKADQPDALQDASKSKKKGKKDSTDSVEKLDPPVRWDVSSKEQFNQLPAVAKKQVLSFWNGIESHTTKLWQDLNRKTARYDQLERVVGHYLPQWNLKGMTDVQAVAELCATQDLIMKDPIKAMHLLCQKTGVTPQHLYAYAQTGQAQQVPQQQQQSQAQQAPLSKDDIRNIFLETTQQQQSQQALRSAVSEVEQLRNETDQQGRYLHPELWDATYLKRVEPLVEDIRRTQPAISWAEATKKALQTLRYLDGRMSSQSSSNPRLSRENEIAKVRQASMSVRGRGGVTNSTQYTPQKGERVEDTIRAVFAQASQSH